jgi:hypothetical protein
LKVKVFEVDSRDGFEEKQFLNFANDIISMQNKSRDEAKKA